MAFRFYDSFSLHDQNNQVYNFSLEQFCRYEDFDTAKVEEEGFALYRDSERYFLNIPPITTFDLSVGFSYIDRKTSIASMNDWSIYFGCSNAN